VKQRNGSPTQIPMHRVSIAEIMRTADFARGAADKRNGRAPALDSYNSYAGESDRVAYAKINASWNYERGRQWACLAPASMPLNIDGRLNPKALALGIIAIDEIMWR
jgi:hypothetical protein